MKLNVKRDLKYLAVSLPAQATYSDAIYELYLRMKIAKAQIEANSNKLVSHVQVKKLFAK